MTIHSSPEHGENNFSTPLEIVLERQGDVLTSLAKPGQLLTPEELSRQLPDAAQIIQRAESDGLAWPSHEYAVPVRPDALSSRFTTGHSREDDREFAYCAGGDGQGFNNFPAIIGAKPYHPHSEKSIMLTAQDAMSRTFYGSKPYLLRAYRVAPEFMASLQKSVAACGGMSEWNKALYRGAFEPSVFPEDAALVRGSRLAYSLLSNLMRTDDAARQTGWYSYGTDRVSPISDADLELWS